MNSDIRQVICNLVPRSWNARQAHDAVHLLQQAIAAIWHVHGESMGKLVLGDVKPRPEEAPTPTKPPAKR